MANTPNTSILERSSSWYAIDTGREVTELGTNWMTVLFMRNLGSVYHGYYYYHGGSQVSGSTREERTQAIKTIVDQYEQQSMADQTKSDLESILQGATRYKTTTMPDKNNKTMPTLSSTWDIFSNAYNMNDTIRRELEKIVQKIRSNAFDKTGLAEAIAKINRQYNLSLPIDISAADLTALIRDNSKVFYETSLEKLSQTLIDQQCEDIIRKNVTEVANKLFEKFGVNWKLESTALDSLRNIIRGTQGAMFRNKEELDKIKDNFKKTLSDEIEQHIGKYKTYISGQFDRVSDTVTSTIDRVTGTVMDRLDVFRTKIDEYSKYFDTNFLKSTIIDKLNDAFRLGTIEEKLKGVKIFGIDLQLDQIFNICTKNLSTNVAGQIISKISPALEKISGILSTVTDTINKAKSYIDLAKQKAKELISKWEKTVMETIAQYEGVLINNIMKFIKIDISGSLGGLFMGLIGGLSLDGVMSGGLGGCLKFPGFEDLLSGGIGGLFENGIGDIMSGGLSSVFSGGISEISQNALGDLAGGLLGGGILGGSAVNGIVEGAAGCILGGVLGDTIGDLFGGGGFDIASSVMDVVSDLF